jgi:hypothetical protein
VVGFTNTVTIIGEPVQGMGIVRCENDGAMMHDNVGHWNGWRRRGGQYVTELPNQTTKYTWS